MYKQKPLFLIAFIIGVSGFILGSLYTQHMQYRHLSYRPLIKKRYNW